MSNNRKQVVILYGGKSVEHEISIRSAKNVYTNIDKNKFDVSLIAIDKSGRWHFANNVSPEAENGEIANLNLDPSTPALQNSSGEMRIVPDVVFPVLHGTDGEDGSIQGMLKALDIPIVGSGVLGSAISMDKIISKKILKESGVPVARYMWFNIHNRASISYEAIEAEIGVPFMIKSGALGSSVGISKVRSKAAFEEALVDSFQYDNNIIAEEFIEGREMECAVIGNAVPRASDPGEIVMVKSYDFYTYTAKYLDEAAIRIDIPATVSKETSDKIKSHAVMAYQALRCEDYARVDLFLKTNGDVIINEINTIPGFTNASMFPMLWQHHGISYTELITTLIDHALNRYEAAKRINTNFVKSNSN